jgi:hypothetical protein
LSAAPQREPADGGTNQTVPITALDRSPTLPLVC